MKAVNSHPKLLTLVLGLSILGAAPGAQADTICGQLAEIKCVMGPCPPLLSNASGTIGVEPVTDRAARALLKILGSDAARRGPIAVCVEGELKGQVLQAKRVDLVRRAD